eukprot:scaffold143066_cov44-Tisochrysis_lutea.AAC.1
MARFRGDVALECALIRPCAQSQQGLAWRQYTMLVTNATFVPLAKWPSGVSIAAPCSAAATERKCVREMLCVCVCKSADVY